MVIFAAMVWAGYHRLDPDYGWHVTMGKYISEKGIPKTDPFSYTMSSYPFIDHEWLTNVIMYRLDQAIGKNGMAWMFAAMAVAALGLGVWRQGKCAGWEMAVLLAAALMYSRGGVRPQVLDWLGLIVLWRGFADKKIWNKWRWAVPMGFCLWANLHGGFAVGVVVLGWMIAWRSLEEKKIDIKDIVVWGLGVVGTVIGPYGWRVWHEVRMQITDRDLGKTIAEWQPFYAALEPAFWMIGVLVVFLMGKYWKKIPWWQATTVLVLLLAGVSSLRHVGLLAAAAVPLLGRLFGVLVKTELKNEEARERARRMYWGLVWIAAILFLFPVLMEGWQGTRRGDFYPTKAVEYLKNQKIDGNLLSDYGWGGYLIREYPEKKVFIDGRMPSWRWPAYAKASAGKSAPEGESDWAMKDYLKIFRDGEYEELFNEYDIETVLMPVPVKVNWLEKLSEKISKWRGNYKEQVLLGEKLDKAGWRKSYEDGTAVVYEKPEVTAGRGKQPPFSD